MGLTHQWLLIFASFSALTSIAMAADLYSLIYKGRANGSLGGGAAALQAIAAVASSLIAQSSTSKFYKASATSMARQALSGLFQGRA
ncbi:hypothetical protein J5N97_023290 [Dioscorea zingiberensis]|uniref:CASP-like protein n=1 Tax=Dioscorea zingiberensis TaxID=325984 RepID=A0A9D5HBT0_9LILI|nr:hypothetical protein J5N97_023290 [Dioscorea zingiberensis]